VNYRIASHMMSQVAKRSLISTLLSVVLMALLLLGLRMPSNGPNIFSVFCLPFYMIGVLFTHNAHAPDDIVVYSSMFLFFFVITFIGQVLWSKRRGNV